ncbi:DNA-3-methyladenine glycosylase I [Shewanella surugensis]|uniref:DNA-3-methyladenine glycosylase I n=1 Tax=Shewanella surugensis TaxID=212020 RepID=A0ABT0LDU4_9GAMM|nr:DNA-3-methyladenine glycosylase I [Shewanella surugensis]MCL1125502.1 DNA-3-methyladenine glycosylase I [Shewanella surugensis]
MSKIESFSSVYQRACDRKGGEIGLEGLLTSVKTTVEIEQIPDDRLLSALSKKVFQSGFIWRIVELKWPAYEQAFFDFEPSKVLMLSPEQLQARASDPALIRHQKKTQAIYENAHMINDIKIEYGSFSRLISAWPEDDIIGLWAQLKLQGTRLGGNTGPYFLRVIGKSTFLLTNDIKGYFKSHKLIDYGFTSKSGLKQVQAVFNHWQQESGRSLTDLSRILALSVGDNLV